jgi:hypothetical protein
MPPFEIQVFVPSSSHAAPLRFAVVVIACTSEPASGSESANAAITSPAAALGRYSFFCASDPARTIGPLPRPCMVKAKSARPAW